MSTHLFSASALALVLALSGCGGQQEAQQPTVQDNSNNPAVQAQAKELGIDPNNVNMNPTGYTALGGSGNGLVSQAIRNSKYAGFVQGNDANAAILLDAENFKPEHVEQAIAALEKHRLIVVESSGSSEASRAKVGELIGKISGGTVSSSADAAALSYYGNGHYGYVPLLPDSTTIDPNGGDNRISSVLGLRGASGPTETAAQQTTGQ